MLDAFYPGELGGDAIIRALTGKVSPAGKLPYTVYKESFVRRDIRVTDLRADGGITYRWFNGTPYWPFGHGLSYTNFSFQWAQQPPPKSSTREDLRDGVPLTVVVTNTGQVVSDCVVLCFAAAVAGSGPDMPLRRLIDFTRLALLRPGEARTVTFYPSLTSLGYTNRKGVFGLEAVNILATFHQP